MSNGHTVIRCCTCDKDITATVQVYDWVDNKKTARAVFCVECNIKRD